MNILVTGNAGFIGSHLVDKLLEDDKNYVVGIDNLSTGRIENIFRHNENKKFIFIKQDLIEDSIKELFESLQIDVVYHLAANPRIPKSIDYPWETHQNNVDVTLKLLEAVKHRKISKFIYASSSAVYNNPNLPLKEDMVPNPNNPYALHKLIGEKYCKMWYDIFKVPTVMLRFFNVYGPRQNPKSQYAMLIPHFIETLSKGEKPKIFGDGNQSRDFTYVEDVVNGLINASQAENVEGEIFNLGAGDNHTVNEITTLISKLCNTDLWPDYAPARIEQRHTLADISKARKYLNWEPKVKIQEGLEITYSSIKKSKQIEEFSRNYHH